MLSVFPSFFMYDDILNTLKDFDKYVRARPDWKPAPKKAKCFTVNFEKLAIHHLASGPYSRFLDTLPTFPSVLPANFYLVPCAIKLPSGFNPADYEDVLTEFVSRLKHFKGNESKHVFFAVGDNFKKFDPLTQSIVFQASAHKKDDVHCMHYSSPIDRKLNRTQIKNCKYDISFQGCNTLHHVRTLVLNHIPILKSKGFKCFVQCTPRYFEELPVEKQENLQSQWIETLDSSKFILCPRGRGLSTVRTFESLSFGRIPVVYADDTKLPLENKINYSRIMVRIPEAEVNKTENYISNFISKYDLEEASKEARYIWEKYFSEDKFLMFIRTALASA